MLTCGNGSIIATMLARDDREHSVPPELRPRLGAIVDMLVSGDFFARLHGVAPIGEDVAHLIESNVEAYGDALAPLQPAAWLRSVYIWMEGYWQVIVDLSTAREAVSDLALHARIADEPGLPISVDGVWVP